MSLDPNTWTLKTTDAVNLALAAAKDRNNPEVTPSHLLAALLRQEEGVVLPVVRKLGLNPVSIRDAADAAVAELPTAYGTETARGKEFVKLIEAADAERAELRPTSTCRPSCCCWRSRPWTSRSRSASAAWVRSAASRCSRRSPRCAAPAA